jgi:RNA 2',3'-cyclic 3'-phosphodiesterase
MTPLRLFVAADPSPSVRDRIRAAMDRARPLAPSARWVDLASLHVTLTFLGDTETERIPAIEAAVSAVALRHAAFDLRFGGAGTFGGRAPRVLWGGLTGDVAPLVAAQRDLAEALVPLGYVPEPRAFTPHLTLARAREPRAELELPAAAAALAGEDFGPTRVGSLVLYSSARSVYTPMATFPLATPETLA